MLRCSDYLDLKVCIFVYKYKNNLSTATYTPVLLLHFAPRPICFVFNKCIYRIKESSHSHQILVAYNHTVTLQILKILLCN